MTISNNLIKKAFIQRQNFSKLHIFIHPIATKYHQRPLYKLIILYFYSNSKAAKQSQDPRFYVHDQGHPGPGTYEEIGKVSV